MQRNKPPMGSDAQLASGRTFYGEMSREHFGDVRGRLCSGEILRELIFHGWVITGERNKITKVLF